MTLRDFIIEEMTVDDITSVREIENWAGPIFQIKDDTPDPLVGEPFICSRAVTEQELDEWMTGYTPW